MREEISRIFREIRPMLMEHYGKVDAASFKEDESAPNAVTEIDLHMEEYLAKELAKILPDAGFVGEEAGGDRTEKKFWIADPIDGTGHFIRGMPFCSSMISLIENGQVALGTIYDFVNDKLYFAKRGEGAFCNDEKIRVSSRPASNAYLGFETHIYKEENLNTFMRLREKVALVKTISSGFEFAMSASGRLDGRVCFDPYGRDYDFAPGSILIEEAGGIVANIGKRSFDYKDLNFIATNKEIFKALTEGPEAIFPIKE